MPRKQTLEEFIVKARKKHGDKYDYSKVIYVNANSYVSIICPNHGIFRQTPGRHLNHGCKRCVKRTYKKSKESKKYSLHDFLKLSKENHITTYNYEKVDFKNMSTKVKIVCPKHGIFEQI
jgi:hypothetical protein